MCDFPGFLLPEKVNPYPICLIVLPSWKNIQNYELFGRKVARISENSIYIIVPDVLEREKSVTLLPWEG